MEKHKKMSMMEESPIIKKIIPRRTRFTDVLMGEGRVMCRWRSSLWKLLWAELLIYTAVYMMISLIYRLGLSEKQQLQFEEIIRWCGKQYTGLPLTFLLGFYVSLVVKRWWEQYCKLPWPDSIATHLRGHVQGSGEKPVIMKRTIVRYCLLSYVLCIRRLSVRLRKRFPTMKDVMKTGLLRPDEAARIGDEDSPEMYGSNWWMPLKWSTELVFNAQKDGMIPSAPGYNGILSQISAFRSGLTSVAAYGHIPVPLVYTQVVTLAVYIYFTVALIGEQWIIRRSPEDELDMYYPIFMTVKFLFYFGWLRVAETLYNPFGEDDDDFELNELVNRHFQVAMSIVTSQEEPPALLKDAYWGDPEPDLTENVSYEEVEATLYSNPLGEAGTETEDTALCGGNPGYAVAMISMVEKRDPMM